MYSTLTTLIDRLDREVASETNVIPWGCPVPAFGNLAKARVATLGLNPSNREFVDDSGDELQGDSRRFHTLRSLGIQDWSEVDVRHLRLILESCESYFVGNPYDRWFKRLDYLIQGTKASFYDINHSACHLDLIPYATMRKWTELTRQERADLMNVCGDTLGLLLRESPVKLVILNGKSVVQHFQSIAECDLEEIEMSTWSLPRSTTSDVAGFAYVGTVSRVAHVELGHDVTVIGYNHNIQSSFGVTSNVINEIRTWVGEMSQAVRS